jgi:Tfp pilus assembly protein PilP
MKRQFTYCCAVLLWMGVILYAQPTQRSVPTPAKGEVQQSGTTQQPGGTPPAAVPATSPAGNEAAVPIYKYEVKGRRDPFRSLDVTRTVQAASAPVVRPPGLKGQLVSEIRVVGVVKSKGALMAIVQGYRNKTFFIHPNDLLYDGKVLEVRNDAVVFSQILTDNQGKKTSQQVVKKLYPTRGEGNNEK